MSTHIDSKKISALRKENSKKVFYYTVNGANDEISNSSQILPKELQLVRDQASGEFIDEPLPTRDGFSVRLPRDDTGEIVKNESYIIYRSNKAEKNLDGYDDFFYEQLVIKTSEGDLYSEAIYGQPTAVLNEIATVGDSQVFDVYRGTGIFKKSSQILVEYDNDLTKPFTPDAIKNEEAVEGQLLKFRRVTVSMF